MEIGFGSRFVCIYLLKLKEIFEQHAPAKRWSIFHIKRSISDIGKQMFSTTSQIKIGLSDDSNSRLWKGNNCPFHFNMTGFFLLKFSTAATSSCVIQQIYQMKTQTFYLKWGMTDNMST